MTQKQMHEASVQVEAGLELREMIRPLLVQVGRSIRSLRMRAASPTITRHSTSTARGTLDSRVALYRKGDTGFAPIQWREESETRQTESGSELWQGDGMQEEAEYQSLTWHPKELKGGSPEDDFILGIAESLYLQSC